MNASENSKAGWRPTEWAGATGVSRSLVYQRLDANRIKSVKCGNARIITTSPQSFLAGLAEEAA